jgi:hypothetical protein
VLRTIPEIKRVNQYATNVEARNNLPYADIQRGPIQGPGVSIYGMERGDEGLGHFAHVVTWTISIYAQMHGNANSQELDDLYAARLLDAFNADLLIDPNGPGVVDGSRLIEITPFEQDRNTWWVTTATLQTKHHSTL